MKCTYNPPRIEYLTFCRDIIASGQHTLIAGTTGSGKSVLLSHIMQALVCTCYPFCDSKSAKLTLIDVKRVELSQYKGLPHTEQFANSQSKAVSALKNICNLIETRYALMERDGLVMWSGSTHYVIIDELADLLLSFEGKQIKGLLQHILQIGRAARVVVIACTQAPARKVLPAELVLNFNQRVALHCASAIESRQIIGVPGAEDLPLNGVCIVVTPKEHYMIDVPMIDRDLHAAVITSISTPPKGGLLFLLKTLFT